MIFLSPKPALFNLAHSANVGGKASDLFGKQTNVLVQVGWCFGFGAFSGRGPPLLKGLYRPWPPPRYRNPNKHRCLLCIESEPAPPGLEAIPLEFEALELSSVTTFFAGGLCSSLKYSSKLLKLCSPRSPSWYLSRQFPRQGSSVTVSIDLSGDHARWTWRKQMLISKNERRS